MSNESPTHFDPSSFSAQLATIIERQRESAVRGEKILAQAEKTNGRVGALETWKAVIQAQTVLIAGGAGVVGSLVAWAITHFLKFE